MERWIPACARMTEKMRRQNNSIHYVFPVAVLGVLAVQDRLSAFGFREVKDDKKKRLKPRNEIQVHEEKAKVFFYAPFFLSPFVASW